MGSLTPTQAKILHILLANVPGQELDRISATGASKSSYIEVRQRAVREGWIRFRYLPSPRLTQTSRIRFRLGRPFADRWKGALQAWRAREDAILLWRSQEVLFSVLWEGSGGDPARPGADAGVASDQEMFGLSWEVSADPWAEEVPVYFDFEGVWAQWASSGSPISYPRSLGREESASPEPPGAAPTGADRIAARNLLTSSFPLGGLESKPARFSSAYLRRREQSAISHHWMTLRAMPDFSRIPSVRGSRIERLNLVTGLMRPGQSPRDLLARLSQHANSTPFLFAFDRTRILLGFAAPRPPWVPAGPSTPLAVISEVLHDIDVEAFPLSSMVPVIDHEYGRLLRGI